MSAVILQPDPDLDARARRMARVAEAYVGEGPALELSRNVVAGLSDGVEDPYQTCVEAVVRRIGYGVLSCSDVPACARAMAREWTR